MCILIMYMLNIQPADTIIVLKSFKFSLKNDEYTYVKFYEQIGRTQKGNSF